ncbi:MAG: DUF87 domain-containing protein [Rhizobiaceae bacterium]|nr:DUF87 domain-containing protein [Rhizobiaceae bacterium]
MLQNTVSQMSAATNPLSVLLDTNSGSTGVGFTIHSSYDEMVVMTNDKWREGAGGIPMNSYLVAASVASDGFATAASMDRRVVLLRIVGRTELSTDRDSLRAVMEHFQDNPDSADPGFRMNEPISFGMLQWSGIKCKVLGTFYVDSSGKFRFGADVEDFFAARHMKVFKPGSKALEKIVNFVDPIRQKKAEDDAKMMGMNEAPSPFQIGTVRFTSASQMGIQAGQGDVPVQIFPGDFLARRTAVFGMTRTGKSNTTKTLVSAVALSALESDLPVGQLILDINGEYSNANNQDEGSSIADVFGDNTVRYRVDPPSTGFRDVRVNFYESLGMGLQFIASNLKEEAGSMSEDLKTLVGLDLQQPADANDFQAISRWQRKVAIYQCILKNAGFEHDPGMRIKFDVNKKVLSFLYRSHSAIRDASPGATNDADREKATIQFFGLQSAGKQYSVDADAAVRFWQSVREIEKACGGPDALQGIRKGNDKWLSSEDYGLLSVLVGKSSKNDALIRAGGSIRNAAREFHSPKGSANVADDIYGLLKEGRVVIVDLSVGPPRIRETMAERIARRVFDRSSEVFTSGGNPPRIVLYVEEAHNLIGKDADLNTTWPRIAKEGAKYGIAMVYATQEPSSIHPNILSNTENFFVTHLNNDNEIRTLARYYDFGDFAESLKRCQDVGFARIKTLSANFTTPTQILLFQPSAVSTAYVKAKANGSSWFKPLPSD